MEAQHFTQAAEGDLPFGEPQAARFPALGDLAGFDTVALQNIILRPV